MDRQRILITGAHLQTGYCTARSLAGVDAQIIGLSARASARFTRSRFWDRIVPVDKSVDAHLEAMLELGKSADARMTLFAAQDEVVQLMSDNRDELEKYYRFVLPAREAVDLMMNKTIFHPWAHDRGFQVPESYIVDSSEELERALDTIQYPIILKPLYRTKEWMERSGRNKVYLLSSKQKVGEINFDLLEAAPKLLLQHFISGGDGNVHFCLVYMDREGRELGYYTGRKVLQWPHLTGSTAIGISTKNERVHRLAHDVLTQAGLRGLGSVEFKLNDRDGQYYITEPTVGRNDYQSYLAVAGGVNLTQIAYYDAIGQSSRAPQGVRKRAVWVDEEYASQAIGKKERRTLLTARNLAKAAKRTVAMANLNLADPMPFALFCADRLPKPIRRLARQLLSRLRPVPIQRVFHQGRRTERRT